MFTILGIVIRSWIYAVTLKEDIYIDAKKEAHLLRDYMMSMRTIYHKQFLNSGIELNDNTLGFLPAHASGLISDRFKSINADGFYIKNVSDKPRNPKNMADESEMEAIRHFQTNKDSKEYSKENSSFMQFAYPIRIKPYCLSCHGNKEEALPSIQKNYDSAYGYKLGDLRGIVSVKIPLEKLNETIYTHVKEDVFISFLMLIFIVLAMFILFRKVSKHIFEVEKHAEILSLKDKLTNTYNRQTFFGRLQSTL